MKEYFERLEQRIDAGFDRIDRKLDNYQRRLSKAEEALIWIRGHLKISLSFLITIISGVFIYYATKL